MRTSIAPILSVAMEGRQRRWAGPPRPEGRGRSCSMARQSRPRHRAAVRSAGVSAHAGYDHSRGTRGERIASMATASLLRPRMRAATRIRRNPALLSARCFSIASASHPSHQLGVARVALFSQRHRPELRAIGAGVLRRLGRALTHTSSHPFAYWLIRPRAGWSHRCVRTPHPAD